MARPVVTSKSLVAASATNIALSQAVAAPGNLTLNGSTVALGVATLDTQRRVIITSGGDDTGITFTVYGTNQTGNPISQTIAGVSGSAAATTLDFKTVTRVAASGAAATTVTVGTNGVGATPWFLENIHIAPVNQSIAVVVTGTVNYTVQYTYDDFFTPTTPTLIPATFDDATLAAKATSGTTVMNDPFRGWRVVINSGTGGVAITGIQAGISGNY